MRNQPLPETLYMFRPEIERRWNAYQKQVDFARLVRNVVDQIRHMNGYREGADIWVGPPLHKIGDAAEAILRELGESE